MAFNSKSPFSCDLDTQIIKKLNTTKKNHAIYKVKSNSTGGAFGFGVKPNYPIKRNLDQSKDNTLLELITTIKN